MNNSDTNKTPIISFYSGGGFMDMGFEQAGFEIIWTNEFDETFIKLHAAGISSWRESQGISAKAEIFNTKSIVDVSTEEILAEAFPNGKPKYFGMIGGPPCQDFSMNGSLKGFAGDRGKLTTLYLNKIMELQPTFFVMENVTGLTKRNQTKEFLQKLLDDVENEYYIDYSKLNSLDFGVPQSRERIFFIGVKKSEILEKSIFEDSLGKWFPFPVYEKYRNAAINYQWPTPSDFGSLTINSSNVPLELCVESCLVAESDLNIIPNANEFFNLYISEQKLRLIKEGETNRPSFKRLHRYKYSPTACYGNNEVHLHPYFHRRLSVRETLRIQGVPDTYVLPKNLALSKKFKMIGNGVPVPLAKAIAESLKEFMAVNKIFQQ